MKNNKQGIYAEEEKKNDDTQHNQAQHNREKHQKEYQEEYQEEKKSETFDESQPLTQTAPIECSFQIIMTEVLYFLYIIYTIYIHYFCMFYFFKGNFVINHSLVPKGESHEFFLHVIADIIEQNMKKCERLKTYLQLRSDGIHKNRGVIRSAVKILSRRFWKENGSKLKSDKGFIYDFQEWLDHEKIEVYYLYIIYVLFIYYLYIIYILFIQYIYTGCCLWISS